MGLNCSSPHNILDSIRLFPLQSQTRACRQEQSHPRDVSENLGWFQWYTDIATCCALMSMLKCTGVSVLCSLFGTMAWKLFDHKLEKFVFLFHRLMIYKLLLSRYIGKDYWWLFDLRLISPNSSRVFGSVLLDRSLLPKSGPLSVKQYGNNII